jgi:hypothetical protein
MLAPAVIVFFLHIWGKSEGDFRGAVGEAYF